MQTSGAGSGGSGCVAVVVGGTCEGEGAALATGAAVASGLAPDPQPAASANAASHRAVSRCIDGRYTDVIGTPTMRPLAITGIGVVTPVGLDLPAFRAAFADPAAARK